MADATAKNDQLIAVHMEEYRALMQEIDTRLKHQGSLFNWALVLFAALSGTIAGYPDSLSKLLEANLQWIFLIIPLVFIAISFDYQAQYFMMANLATYLNLSLRRRVCRLLGVRRRELLGWQDYLMTRRTDTRLIEGLSWNARYMVLVIIPLLWVLIYLVVVFGRPDVPSSTAEWSLLVINTVGLVFLIYSNVIIARRFYALTGARSKRR